MPATKPNTDLYSTVYDGFYEYCWRKGRGDNTWELMVHTPNNDKYGTAAVAVYSPKDKTYIYSPVWAGMGKVEAEIPNLKAVKAHCIKALGEKIQRDNLLAQMPQYLAQLHRGYPLIYVNKFCPFHDEPALYGTITKYHNGSWAFRSEWHSKHEAMYCLPTLAEAMAAAERYIATRQVMIEHQGCKEDALKPAYQHRLERDGRRWWYCKVKVNPDTSRAVTLVVPAPCKAEAESVILYRAEQYGLTGDKTAVIDCAVFDTDLASTEGK